MTPSRLLALRISLVTVGTLSALLGPLMLFWPSGWRWTPYQTHYEQMMVGVYLTLAVFLIRAARDPLQSLGFIWFTVWLSLVHGVVMAVPALSGPEHRGHLVGDVPALFLAAAVLGVLTPRQISKVSAERALGRAG